MIFTSVNIAQNYLDQAVHVGDIDLTIFIDITIEAGDKDILIEVSHAAADPILDIIHLGAQVKILAGDVGIATPTGLFACGSTRELQLVHCSAETVNEAVGVR